MGMAACYKREGAQHRKPNSDKSIRMLHDNESVRQACRMSKSC